MPWPDVREVPPHQLEAEGLQDPSEYTVQPSLVWRELGTGPWAVQNSISRKEKKKGRYFNLSVEWKYLIKSCFTILVHQGSGLRLDTKAQTELPSLQLSFLE